VNETFNDVKAGDVLSARMVNKLTDAVEKLAGAGPMTGAGASESNTGGVKGSNIRLERIIMVRLTVDILPMSSALYDWAGIEADTDNDGGNAVIQIWDESGNAWIDSGSGETEAEMVTVVVGDDLTGWRPLIANDRLPVIYNRGAGAYVPLEKRESAVVIVDSGPDSDGYYLGRYVIWDSDNEQWLARGACYIIDVGSGPGSGGGGGGSGFSGTVP
jgi:hypothetical protein